MKIEEQVVRFEGIVESCIVPPRTVEEVLNDAREVMHQEIRDGLGETGGYGLVLGVKAFEALTDWACVNVGTNDFESLVVGGMRCIRDEVQLYTLRLVNLTMSREVALAAARARGLSLFQWRGRNINVESAIREATRWGLVSHQALVDAVSGQPLRIHQEFADRLDAALMGVFPSSPKRGELGDLGTTVRKNTVSIGTGWKLGRVFALESLKKLAMPEEAVPDLVLDSEKYSERHEMLPSVSIDPDEAGRRMRLVQMDLEIIATGWHVAPPILDVVQKKAEGVVLLIEGAGPSMRIDLHWDSSDEHAMRLSIGTKFVRRILQDAMRAVARGRVGA